MAGERNAERDPLERAAVDHRRDRVAQRLVGGAGEVEAVLEPVGVDGDDAAAAIEHRRAGRPGGARRGVLHGAGDRTAAGAAEAGSVAVTWPHVAAAGGGRP